MARLRRTLTTFTLTLYGVGVMVGAGIFVLVGKVAALVGEGVGVALLIAAAAALPTGLSYAELAGRFPKSGGEAVYVGRAFGKPRLSFAVGYLILASGVASVAAVSHGFAHYFSDLIGVSGDLVHLVVVVLFVAALTFINHRGIRESTWVNVLSTVVSVAALLVIVFAAIPHWGQVDVFSFSPPRPDPDIRWPLVAAVALAFYGYIGFEDICNVAEEVRDPQRTIPRATLLSIGITAVLYLSVGVSVVAVSSPAALADSDVPLALVSNKLLPSLPPGWLSLIALFAVLNTALLNLVMCSRLLYGMSRDGLIHRGLSHLDETRKTPTRAVLLSGVLAALVALTGFLKVLAEATSAIILCAFFVVNLSLIVIRVKRVPPEDETKKHFTVPLFVPAIGLVTTAYFAVQFSAGAYLRLLALLLVGLALHAAGHRGGAASRNAAPDLRS